VLSAARDRSRRERTAPRFDAHPTLVRAPSALLPVWPRGPEERLCVTDYVYPFRRVPQLLHHPTVYLPLTPPIRAGVGGPVRPWLHGEPLR
jgi:hypothetical protein